MSVSTFIIACLFATGFMSAFSALWSRISGHEFREHVLLSHLYTSGETPNFTIQQRIIGWCIHIGMGAVFLLGYEVLWHFLDEMRTVEWSLIFGTIIGLIGILGWIVMFKVHKNPPHIKFEQYYVQLFFAHLVFSITAYIVYVFLN